MKNIIVYIAIFMTMLMPTLGLSAEITLRTNDPFATNNSPFNNNNPFAGGTPKNIERNLFAPKSVQNQYRRVSLNQNKQRNSSVSYLNSDVTYKSKSAIGGNAAGGGSTLRRYNTPTNYSENNATAVYSMSARLKVSEINEVSDIEENTTTTPENPYEGAGAPSTFAPIGDVVWPLLLFALAYVTIKRRTKK
jgi:hypothetical protein